MVKIVYRFGYLNSSKSICSGIYIEQVNNVTKDTSLYIRERRVNDRQLKMVPGDNPITHVTWQFS